MDPPSKKRSIFGFTGLFRSPSVPAEDRDMNTDASPKPAAPATAQREFNNSASAPHSPMKRASESQIASRRIIGRPQGPSSKLSQSISASDIAHRPSSMVVKRMPGDNPNKRPPVMSASVMSHAPSSSVVPKSTSFSGVTSTPRNLFRSSALYSRPNMQTFSPRVPAAASNVNQSFPPNTPGKPPRGSTADVNGRILANTTSTELFKMRIPSPPRHLTGEMLASEVPDDPNRSGSVYADEFLAHYCPPDLDEHQRRQFFCILDLRRLKYAADDVFTKKDWKINILNFAKEYEKSRSLIMLRYGLYEFKTVRASEAVKKEWKQKHGIPDSEDESGSPRANGTPKRKAEEELTPTSNTLSTSASGSNKRARAQDASVKNKRKADSEPDENHPAKLQKPAAPPSATKSVFESIANNAQSASATPVKSTGKTLFASSTQPNGSLGTSVFGAAPKPVGSTNIFGHLSDGSKGSGNEGADEESDTGSEAEEEESEAQDVSQSDEQAASGGVSTPQLFDTQKPTTNGLSSASSEAGDSTQGRSIFDRITRGTDGQPIRKVSPSDGGLFAPPPEKERSASPVKEQPAAAPANNTWNAATPIKFAPTAAPVFGSTTQQPAGSSAVDFGAAASKKTTVTPPADPTKEAAPQSFFGAQTNKADGAAPSAAVNGTTPNLFASFGAKTADTPAAAPPAFGGFGTSTSTGPNPFGGAAPAFGQKKEGEEAKDSKPAAALFGAQPAATAPEAAKTNLFQPSTMFGNQNKSEVAPTTQSQFGGLFGKTPSAEAEKPAASLFGANATKPANNLFGSSTVPVTTSTDEPTAKKPAFGSTENKPSSSLFGSAASTPAPESAETKNLFGGASTSAAPATETKSIFSGITAAPATQANNLFGASTPAPAPAQEAKPLFGSTVTDSKPLFGATAGSAGSKPIFGATAGATETKPAGLFANPPAPTPASSAPIFSFGSSQAPAASQPAAPQTDGSIFGANGGTSFTFGAGAPDNNTIKNPFSSDGTFSAPSSFNFGSGDAPSTSTSFTFGAGSSNTPTINFGGASDNGAQQSVSFGGASSTPAFSFGGASQPSSAPIFSQNPPSATPIFGNSLVPGGGTSTGTSK